MAISSADIALLTDYSWAEIKRAIKTAMVSGVLGGNQLSINGRSIGRYSLDELKGLYQWADANEQLDDGYSPFGAVLVQYGERY